MRLQEVAVATAFIVLTGCNSTADQWKSAAASGGGRIEQAQEICKGRAAGNFGQVRGGLLVRAITSDSVFRGCMAEQGFVQKP